MSEAERAHCDWKLALAMGGDWSDKAAPHAHMNLIVAREAVKEAWPRDGFAGYGLEWFSDGLARLELARKRAFYVDLHRGGAINRLTLDRMLAALPPEPQPNEQRDDEQG